MDVYSVLSNAACVDEIAKSQSTTEIELNCTASPDP